MIIVQTPLRVSFLGGGSDYPEHFEQHGGAILGTAIDKFSYITVGPLTRFVDHRFRIAYSRLELVNRVDEIQHPVIRECLRHVGIEGGVEINCMSDLPAKTGLGSSSTFTVCLLHALHAYQGRYVPCEQIAREAIRMEREVLKERVGCQDQCLAALGGLRFIEFGPGTAIRPEIAPIGAARLAALERTLLLVFTGLTRSANEVLKEQIDRTASNAPELNAMRDLARRGLTVLCGDGPLDEFGRLLHEGWLLKRGLSSQVSNPTIDALYERGLAAGAVGGKLLGAGAGGFLLFHVPQARRDAVRAALGECPEVRFRFEGAGSRIIFFTQNMSME